jgi:hypothetical protein
LANHTLCMHPSKKQELDRLLAAAKNKRAANSVLREYLYAGIERLAELAREMPDAS